MPPLKKPGKRDPTSLRIETWKVQVCQAVGISPAQIFNEGFNGRFDMIISSGKIKSKTIEQLIEVTQDEIKVLERRVEILKNALNGTLTNQMEKETKEQFTLDIIIDVMGDTRKWKQALPENDPIDRFYDNWERASDEIKRLSGQTVNIADLIKYVRHSLRELPAS